MGGRASAPLTARELLVIADDLAGAAETAAALTAEAGISCELHLVPCISDPASSSVVVVDTDSRYVPGTVARNRVRAALDVRSQAAVILKKVDSLARGPIAEEVAELMAGGLSVIASLALPAMNRIVTNGVIRLEGTPLHQTAAWAAERSLPPRSLAALFSESPVEIVPLSVVRGAELADVLVNALRSRRIALCDAADQSDLELIADAALSLTATGRRIALVGTGALARAVGRSLSDGTLSGHPHQVGSTRPVLIIAGTVAPVIAMQTERLVESGITGVTVTPADLDDARIDEIVPRIRRALSTGVALVSVDRDAIWHRDDIALLVANIAAEFDLGSMDLVLTGGETARRTLESARISTLYPEREIAHGVVLSRTDTGGRVVTRPGSFGGPDSLLDIVRELKRGAITPVEEKEDAR